MKTSESGQRQPLLTWTAVLGLAAGGMVAVSASPAAADEFDPTNVAPAVSSVTDTLAMAPDQEISDNVYTIDATVTDANSLLDLNTVTVCLYNVGQGVSTCGDADQDARDTVLMTWTRSNDTFTIDATTGGTDNSHWNLGHVGTTDDSEVSANTNANYSFSSYSAAATSMNMRFTFRTSEVAKEGTNWGVLVTANDGDTTGTAADTVGYTVAHYARVSAQRAEQDWNTVAAETKTEVNNVSAGTVISNGGTDIQMSISAYTDGTTALTNAGGSADDAVTTDRQFAMDVDVDDNFDAGSNDTRLTSSLAEVDPAVLSSGTGEAGDATILQGFQFQHGGGVPRSGAAYTATVVVGVTAD